MTFNSMPFVLFFAVVVPVYFLLPARIRWCLLLPSSYFFYICWRPEYALLLLITTWVDYSCGIQIGQSRSLSRKRVFLLISICTDLGILFTFKYLKPDSPFDLCDRVSVAP